MAGFTKIDVSFEDINRCAKWLDGKIYGGFVRDVIIPKTYGKDANSDHDYNDIDIWFDSRKFTPQFDGHSQPGAFVTLIQRHADLILKLSDNKSNGQSALEYGGGFSRYDVYHGSDPELKLFSFVMVVSDYFPVCDFNVNCFTYDGDKITLEQPNIVGSHGKHYNFSIDAFDTLNDILSKRICVLPTYFKAARGKSFGEEIDELLDYCPKRVNERIANFSRSGWKMVYDAYEQ